MSEPLQPNRERLVRVGLALAALVLAVALAVTLYGAYVNLTLRPLDGVEGDALFEASRLRAGLPIYVDPVFGAHDYGPIPARWFVLYPPIWPWLLSHIRPDAAASVARGLSMAAWWGLCAWIAYNAGFGCKRSGPAAAAFVAGVYALAEFGGSARPDSLALLLAGTALVSSLHLGRVDPVSAAVFALAAWTKPNVVGMACGAMLVTLARERWRAWSSVFAAAGVSAALAYWVERESQGTWLTHLRFGTGQPLSAALFVHHLRRLQFFGLPLGFAMYCGWKARRTAQAQLALGALGASTAWAFFTFAKTGSAANYWMEPCVAGAALLARVPLPSFSPRTLRTLAVAAPLQALWTDVASVRATLESIEANAKHSELVTHARDRCGARPDQLIVADEPGIELMLDGGRIVEHAFPLTHAGLRGSYPFGPWISDLARPEIACVLTAHDRIERPLSEVDVDYDYFAPPVRAALAARFAPREEAGGWELYGPRGSALAPR